MVDVTGGIGQDVINIPLKIIVFDGDPGKWQPVVDQKSALEGTGFRKVIVCNQGNNLVVAFGPVIPDSSLSNVMYNHHTLVEELKAIEPDCEICGGCWCRWWNGPQHTKVVLFFSDSEDYGLAYALMLPQVTKAISVALGLPASMVKYNIKTKPVTKSYWDFQP